MPEIKFNLNWKLIAGIVMGGPTVLAFWSAFVSGVIYFDNGKKLFDNAPRIIEAVNMVLEVDEEGTPEYEKYKARMAYVEYLMEEDAAGTLIDLIDIACDEHPDKCD